MLTYYRNVTFLLLFEILASVALGCGGGNGTGPADTGSDDGGTSEGPPVSAVPFDYLDCVEAEPVPDDPPAGGTPILSGNTNAFGGTDSGADEVAITTVQVEGQSFSSARQVAIVGVPENPWNIQVQDQNTAPVAVGDVLLGEVWARCEDTELESDECRMLFVIEDNETYEKIIQYPVVVGREWRHLFIPIASTAAYAAGGANVSLFVGYGDQTVEVGLLQVTSYGPDASIDDLPKSAVTYAGIRGDAPWREQAGARIDAIRRGEMTVEVVNGAGAPVENATISVEMTRHAFLWGSAISSGIIATDEAPEEYDRYTEEIVSLFNIVTAYNAFKWKPLVGDWGDGWNLDRATDTLDWALEQGLAFRGHVVIWPGWGHLPNYLEGMAETPDLVREAVLTRIDDIMTATLGKIDQWDIVNEPVDNRDLMDLLGDDIMIEWFERARETDPNAALYLNDYAILTGGAGPTGHRDKLEYWIELLDAAGAPVDGLGLQSHFGLALTGPEAVYDLLERYGTAHDKRISITEYDVNVNDDNLAGCFTHDFMTAVFSHEKVDTFVMWGFKGEADPLFDEEWNLKTAGRVYKDLVFDRWWTNETLTSDSDGKAALRAFYGDYIVTVEKGGKTVSQTASHSRDEPLQLTLTLE